MRKILAIFIILVGLVVPVKAQELDCRVSVSSQQLQAVEQRVFETLRTQIFEFMNQRQWTNYSYTMDERIECSILINVTGQVGSDRYKATIQVQSRRPVFNTSYNTVMLNIIDKDFEFEYVENTPLEYSDGTYLSNLTGVLAYYAYLIIGYDFDSYKPSGGTPYFEKAQTIVTMAQSNRFQDGWMAFGNQRNRYWLVENLLNGRYSALRDVHYAYHRRGFDLLYDEKEKARGSILENLEELRKVHNDQPYLYALNVFIQSKSDELIKLYSDPSVAPMEKARASNVLSTLDPSNANKYQDIQQN